MRVTPILFAAVAYCSISVSASAEDITSYPSRPIRVIIPVGAGAGIDTAARITAAAAEKNLRQKFIIENKPGASQRLGASMVAHAQPDGYTLLFTSPAPVVVSQFFPPKLDYNPATDLRPVAIGMFQPVLLVVRPSLGVHSVDEFVDYAKKNPGKLSFAVQGIGGEMHLALEHFRKTAGVNITPVPYNSGAQAIIDLLADRVDAMFLVVPPIKGHLASGKLLALATLNAKRIAALPNVPTMAELGRPEMTSAIWFGYLAPGKTPQPVVDKLAAAFLPLMSDHALSKRVTEMGAELDIVGPAAFGKIIDSDRARYGKIVSEGNLAKPD